MFPSPSADTLTAFAYHSTRIERIPLSKQDIDQTLAGTKVNPFFEGQLKVCDLSLMLAANPDLIPPNQPANWQNSLQQLAFLQQYHRNLMNSIARYGIQMEDPTLIKPSQVGEWRDERKWVVDREMPSPIMVPHHLHDWWTDLIDFHNRYREKIEMPQLLDEEDLKALADKAYEANLKLCCIKPFVDGSNRLGRIIENLLRLNFGLPWKVIRHEDEYKLPYIDDIQKMQGQYPA